MSEDIVSINYEDLVAGKKASKKTKTTKTKTKSKKKKTEKKTPAKVPVDVEEAEKQRFLSRAFQSNYDNRFQVIVKKFNKFACPSCDFDVEINQVVIFNDPATDRRFLTLHRACSTACDTRVEIFELTRVSAEELEKQEINLFTFES